MVGRHALSFVVLCALIWEGACILGEQEPRLSSQAESSLRKTEPSAFHSSIICTREGRVTSLPQLNSKSTYCAMSIVLSHCSAGDLNFATDGKVPVGSRDVAVPPRV